MTLRPTTRLPHLIGAIVGLILAAATASAQTDPPDDWLDAHIGGATGAWSYNDDGFSVSASGTDIWGTADSFHFVYEQLNGDGELRARIILVSGTQDWTKAGLMIRQTLDPGSPHHFLLASKGKGLAYQRRLTQGGTSLSTSVAGAVPVWLRIRRAGTLVEMATSNDGVNWHRVATVTWPTGPTLLGFAVTSHDGSTTPTAFGRFERSVALTGNARSAPFVDVVSPRPGDVVRTNAPYLIQWQASTTDADRLDHFNVYVGTDQSGTVTYEPIAGCTNVPADARSCNWASPGPASDRAYVLVTAVDALNDQGASASGPFTIESPQVGSLPAGWSDRDIGSVSAAGSASFDAGRFTVTGSGADIWGTADEFHYASRLMS